MRAVSRLAIVVVALAVIGGAAAAQGYVGPFRFAAKPLAVASRGETIPAVLTLPLREGAFPLVVMAHGHGGSKDENGGFAAIAESLAARGVASVRMDFPGCGSSSEPFARNNITNMLADLRAARAAAIAAASIDARRVGIFGYSMGGRLAILSGGEGYKSLGLLAPVGLAGPSPMYTFMGGSEKYAALSSKAAAEGHVLFTTPYGQVQDLGRQWFDDNAKADCLGAIAAFSGPVLFVTGTADTIIPLEHVQQTAQAALKSPCVELVQVAGADHGYGFYGGDPAIKVQVVEAVASFFALTL